MTDFVEIQSEIYQKLSETLCGQLFWGPLFAHAETRINLGKEERGVTKQKSVKKMPSGEKHPSVKPDLGSEKHTGATGVGAAALRGSERLWALWGL